MRFAAVLLVSVLASTPAEAELRSREVVSGLSQLVAYLADPVVPDVFYAVQQSGIIHVVENGSVKSTPFLDLRSAVTAGGERGLLGMAFAPDVASGRVFVNFTNTSGDTVVTRFRRTGNSPLVVDPASRFDLVWGSGNAYIAQSYSNHNGGHLAFGPDGYLYIGLGDGGSANDPENRAQDPNTLLGKMLRIDINVPDSHPRGYEVPADNPFRGAGPAAALEEIWAFGLRNPWRYSFDDPALGGTGALFIGDVGQGAREEIDYEPAGAGGRNYGWPIREGTVATNLSRTSAFTPLTAPMLEYPRSFGVAVTGGYVYRGTALGAQYVGRYFFGDYGSGRLWSVRWQATASGTAVWSDAIDHTAELGTLGPISSFGVDRAGELYLVIHSGRVLKIIPPGSTVPSAPSNLSAHTSDRTVTLSWSESIGALQYLVEVGSQTGTSDLLQYHTGSSATSLTAAAIPDGVYYVRVRGLNAAGASAPSNEIVLSLGCAEPPAPPTAFSHSISGRSVTLNWAAAGSDIVSIVLEVRTESALTNVAALVFAASSRSVSGSVPPGTYFARLRTVNACGASAPSTELVVTVR